MHPFEKEIIAYLKSLNGNAISVNELEAQLNLDDADAFKALIKTLVALEQTGRVSRTKKDKYYIQDSDYVEGTLSQHKKGFAFVRPIIEGTEDVFIPPNKINKAMDGDTVRVKVTKDRDGRLEGEVKTIVTRAVTQVVGTYTEARHFGFVLPDDKRITQDIFIPKGRNLGAVEGHKVLVEITEYPDGTNNPEGFVKAILGHKNDPGVDILSIIYQHGINIEFNEATIEEANQVPDEISPNDLENRVDLRKQLTITIDGADAKDLDDAISVEKLDNGNYRLIVSIADVSHYVTEGSALDADAFERGTSVYLVDRVIPMIPHRLSNGICSLNPHVDRLTLSCDMEINTEGKVIKHEIYQSVIHSDERMTYDNVNKILEDQDEILIHEYQHIVEMLRHAKDLADILKSMRVKRGEIDFDLTEAKIMVDEVGVPKDVLIRNRGLGERLIESFMLIANETVAQHFHEMQVPFIYRIHEEPKADRLKRFFEFITNFGVLVKGGTENIHPKTLQNIGKEIKGKPEELVISTLMLRSMQQAKYSDESLGHFGLSAEYYTHFTSPIRRYPDLIVHRLIRKYLIEHSMNTAQKEKWADQLVDIAEHTSKRERRAIEAERDTDDLKKSEYMIQHLGETFDGIITSVANFGMFVELPNTIEGMVHNSNMTDDYYRFEERHMALIGERTGKVFRIGDKVKVKVVNVNVDERMIDFAIVGMDMNKIERRIKEVKLKTEQRGNKEERPRKKGRGKAAGHKKATRNKKKNIGANNKQGDKPFYKSKAVKKKRKRK